MKTILLSLFLICSLSSFGQKQKGFFSADLAAHFIQNSNPAFSFSISGGANSNGMMIGPQIGFVKFPSISKVYIPLQLKFIAAPIQKATSPIIMIEPGYGIYNQSYKVGTTTISQTGGFVFFGGVGVRFSGKQGDGGFIAVGYSTFGFNTDNVSSHINGITVKVGGISF